MNQTIRQKQAVLQVLRDHLSKYTSDMYQRIGREEPGRVPSFSVVPQGCNTFEVIEHPGGRVMAELPGNDTACQLAKQLTNNVKAFAAIRRPIKSFARKLLHWTAGGALMLILFAYYGAGH